MLIPHNDSLHRNDRLFQKSPARFEKNKTGAFPDNAKSADVSPHSTDHLDDIKKKIKAGFYNSESVLEDLSHSFTRALDQTI